MTFFGEGGSDDVFSDPLASENLSYPGYDIM